LRKYLAVYGLGACWSGYDAARVILAESQEQAEDKAFYLAADYADAISPKRGGYSYDAELIETTVDKTGNFRRLKFGVKVEKI